nr:hypothetical protein [Tanacetum cinerariifolium]
METKDTLSSCSDLDKQEIQQLQKQTKILKENFLNTFNALKTTTQRLERQTFTYCSSFQQAFAHLFHTDTRTFKYELSQNMNNLEKQLNNEILREKNSKPALRDKDYSRIVSNKGNDQGLENQSNTSGDESSRLRNECNDKSTSGNDIDIRPSYDTEPMAEVSYTAEYNVFTVGTQHSEQLECIINTCIVEKVDSNVIPNSPDMCDNDIQTTQNAKDERVVLVNLIGNLKLDVDENKKIQKQLKKGNASLTQELKECKSTLVETSRTLGESNSIRDSYLVALKNK